MGGLALRGLLDRGEAARLGATADFERLGFHVLNFHFSLKVGGALTAPPVHLGGVATLGSE